MFSFFKKRTKESPLPVPAADKGNFGFQLELRSHGVGDLFTVSVPADLVPYESDRFRAKTADGKRALSITVFRRPWKGERIDQRFLEELELKLFQTFVDEGGYVPYDDLKATDSFIRRSFKVDAETQSYLTSAHVVAGTLVIVKLIVRDRGPYDRNTMPTLEVMNRSIVFR